MTFKEWLKRDFRLLVREELTTDENAGLLAFGNMVWDAALKQGAQKTPTNKHMVQCCKCGVDVKINKEKYHCKKCFNSITDAQHHV